MGFGVAYPMRINARGGLATQDDNLPTVMALQLLPGMSSNPYNDRDGVGMPLLTWEPNSAETEAITVARIERRFLLLERAGRARLESVTRHDPIGADDGVFRLSVVWINLETGTTETTVLPGQT